AAGPAWSRGFPWPDETQFDSPGLSCGKCGNCRGSGIPYRQAIRKGSNIVRSPRIVPIIASPGADQEPATRFSGRGIDTQPTRYMEFLDTDAREIPSTLLVAYQFHDRRIELQ